MDGDVLLEKGGRIGAFGKLGGIGSLIGERDGVEFS